MATRKHLHDPQCSADEWVPIRWFRDRRGKVASEYLGGQLEATGEKRQLWRMKVSDKDLAAKWLEINDIKNLPSGEAEDADNLRFFSKRGSASVYVIGEGKQAVNRSSEMHKRNRRIARKKARQITNRSFRRKRHENQ